ncbi:MAG: PIN domain-containing protein [Thermodesulfobacteriota bacterium]|nr:PIN domain-containing protein [Thermodesulfobacteriota bacterium]
MIFLDTSAIYALADKADPNHKTAYGKFENALKSGEIFLLHNYILLESAALLQAMLGGHSAILFLKEAKSFEVEWVDMELHEEAVKKLEEIGKKGISLVDCASFVVMRRKGVQKVFAFDPDFSDQGFTIY